MYPGFAGIEVLAANLASTVCASKVAARIEVVAGDFFADPLPPGDLYGMGRILHDWREEKIHRLLSKMHELLPPGGGVLIMEKLIDEDRRGPV